MILLLVFSACKGDKTLWSHERDSCRRTGPWESTVSVEKANDDGTLDCVAGILKAPYRHNNTARAFQNVTDHSSNGDTVVLIGHGTSGTICTGEGDVCSASDTTVTFDNVDDWRTQAARLKVRTGMTIRLVGCGVGVGKYGAQLLHEIANESGCTVMAPTADVYCRRGVVELDPNGCWHTETPGTKEGKPEYSTFTFIKENYGVFYLKSGRAKVLLSNIAELRLDVFSLSGYTIKTLGGAPDRELMLSSIDFAEPFNPGTPLAIRTGSVSLQINGETKSFDVLGDNLLRDVDNKHVYYRAGRALPNRLLNERFTARR